MKRLGSIAGGAVGVLVILAAYVFFFAAFAMK